MYVGIGYDVHRFVENSNLILGGVCFDHSLPHPKSHSPVISLCDLIFDITTRSVFRGQVKFKAMAKRLNAGLGDSRVHTELS
jgi:2C-methyl-D-erythritol 2,4-cyclodiphosphate synthase